MIIRMLGLNGLITLLRLADGIDAPLPQIELAPPVAAENSREANDNENMFR